MKITIDTRERKSLPILKAFFPDAAIEELPSGDIFISEGARNIMIEIKIGNDITDENRCRNEIFRMAIFQNIEKHFIFSFEDMEPADSLAYIQKLSGDLFTACIQPHYIKSYEKTLLSTIQKIMKGSYIQPKLRVKMVFVDDIATSWIALIPGVSSENAVEIVKRIKNTELESLGMNDIIRTIVSESYFTLEDNWNGQTRPIFFLDEIFGVKKCSLKGKQYKMSEGELCMRFRKKVVHDIINVIQSGSVMPTPKKELEEEAITMNVDDIDPEVRKAIKRADMEDLFPSKAKIGVLKPIGRKQTWNEAHNISDGKEGNI